MFSNIKPSLRESSSWLVLTLRLVDSAIIVLLIYPLARLHNVSWAEHYETLMIISFFLSLLSFHSVGLYRPRRGQNFISEFKLILKAWFSLVCLILFLLFAFKIAQKYSRLVLLTWFLLTPLVITLLHGLARTGLHFLRANGKNQKTAVIVGAGDLGLSFARYIEEIPWTGIRVQGFFDDRKKTEDIKGVNPQDKTILGTLPDLCGYLEHHDVDYVYIALPMRAEKKIYEILNSCRTLGARIYLIPDLYAFRFFNNRLQTLGDVLLLDFNPDSNTKRIFDICFSLLVILFTLPLTLLIALLIKLQDGGPLFYGHGRIATAGKEFSCLKFRTMHVDADKKLDEILKNDTAAQKEWEKTFKLKKDPRVTWIGRFLRKTSLDELPQFINVLKGDMSVVGARPIVSKELSVYYKENSGLYCSAKPGITGPWQVSKRSDTENYEERVALDTWYVLNQSFILDMKIIFNTVGCVIKGKGAY